MTRSSADMSAWRPTTWYLVSMPTGGTYSISSADMSAWRPTTWYLVSIYVRVPIEAEEWKCGRCQGLNYGPYLRRYCGMFPTKKNMLRGLVMIDGVPQRCPQCLAAEVKTEEPNA